MDLIGRVRRHDQSHFVLYRASSGQEIWFLVREYHIDDEEAYFSRGKMTKPILTEYNIEKLLTAEYVVSAVKRLRISGVVTYYGIPDEVTSLLADIRYYMGYRFNKNNILEDSSEAVIKRKNISEKEKEKMHLMSAEELSSADKLSPSTVVGLDFFGELGDKDKKKFNVSLARSFEAVAENLSVKYSMYGSVYSYLRIVSLDFSIEMKRGRFRLPKLLMEELEELKETERINGLSMPIVDYTLLEAKMGGLPWYKDKSGNTLKDYRTVKDKEEFEWMVMKDLVEEYERCTSSGEEFILAMDTETTGLNICSLPKGNPLKSHMVAVPLSWRDHQGVVVFTDMEYFSNVETLHVANRLREFFELPRPGQEVFTCSIPSEVVDGETVYRDVTIDRRLINLTGHNTLFDGVVWYDEGVYVYFNNDTMQIAFNMDPEMSRGKKGLKVITRKLFNVNTPELSDVAGKGNEDKYRYISDEEVAAIYGGADGDFSRLCYKALREICPAEMMKNYRIQDMPLIYSLIPAQYNGMRMDIDAVKRDGALCKANIDRIKELIYVYVGTRLDLWNKIEELNLLLSSGLIDEEEFDFRLGWLKPDPDSRYVFKLAGKEVKDVIFNKLKYPVTKISEKSGEPSLDKGAMEKLMSYKKTAQEVESDVFKMVEDIPDLLEPGSSLIKAKEFNKYRYPLAYLLDVYSTWNKEYTSYYKPILQDGMEGRLYKSFSTTRIETRRIANPGQTMKGSLKRLVKSHGDDWYLCDWDMSQVEYRIMISLAGFDRMIEVLKDAEKDFHTETASLVHAIPPHQVPKKLRSETKPISFGIPYGLGDRKMCENIFHEVNDDTLYETRKLLLRFKRANKEVIDYLEKVRDEALIPRTFPEGFKEFMGVEADSKLGWVKNPMGFWRLFKLDDIDNKARASIRRKAGNYPIQSFAAELFRKALINFKLRILEEGLDDKIQWHMLIHDELLFSVHKSIHPYRIYKMLREECVQQIEGHTNYYIGINIGDTWEDCKNDKFEAPVRFVKECVEKYEAGEVEDTGWMEDAKSYVMDAKMRYVRKRVHEVLKELYPSVDDPSFPIDMRDFVDRFTNYIVRSYVNELFKPHYKVPPGADFNHTYLSYFESYLLAEFGEGRTIIDLEGNLKKVMFNEAESSTIEPFTVGGVDFGGMYDLTFEEDDAEFDFESNKGTSDYWSFDTSGDPEEVALWFAHDYYTDEDALREEDDLLTRAGYDEEKLDAGASLEEAMKTAKPVLKYVKIYPQYILITVVNKESLKIVKSVLKGHLSKTEGKGVEVRVELLGQRVVFPKLIRKDVDWYLVDEQLDQKIAPLAPVKKEISIKESYQNIRILPNGISVNIQKRIDIAKVKEYLSSEVGSEGKTVTFTGPGFSVPWLPVNPLLNYKGLDDFVTALNSGATAKKGR